VKQTRNFGTSETYLGGKTYCKSTVMTLTTTKEQLHEIMDTSKKTYPDFGFGKTGKEADSIRELYSVYSNVYVEPAEEFYLGMEVNQDKS